MPARIVESVLSLVFPSVCELCDEPVAASPPAGICKACEGQIHLIPGPHCRLCGRLLKMPVDCCAQCVGKTFGFDRAYACAVYEGSLKELIHAYKFNGRKHLKHYFAGLLTKFIEAELDGCLFDAVVSVPLDAQKKMSRGFNQSALLSAELGRRLRIPDFSGYVFRSPSLKPQHRVGKAERRENVRGCFTVSTGHPLTAKKLLLIDDVLTTGLTASECAWTLKRAGASSVTVLACARGV